MQESTRFKLVENNKKSEPSLEIDAELISIQ
jgi:hypothetical protein